ncbi:hypothetical protein H2200_010385 [Cladophialophora chaetospira]|uniref:EF hand domain protein n=1 Tax=Cladophialophora chaetospira TaxID=386627 RepID=A0AA38X1C4_9EURO|nr:hypothetical protein H2200_010385 [Cladophialophora chaetospira]
MSTQEYRKPLVLALAGAVALTAVFYTYQHYGRQPRSKPESEPATSLHRSNAIRRPRGARNLGGGYQLILPYDPVEQACQHLRQRNEAGEGYGEYHNPWFFGSPEDFQGLDLNLIPRNLDPILETLQHRLQEDLSPEQRAGLRAHIQGMFVQNFIQEEFPEGYTIGDDCYRLDSKLSAYGILPNITFKVAKAFDQGRVFFFELFNPLLLPASRPVPNPTQTDGATEADGADGILPRQALQALAAPDDNADDSASDISFGRRQHDKEDDPAGSQHLLDLLYQIAAEQARREGYIHRGVECNSCAVHPILGTRYHCANCFDYDLCEACEALGQHNSTHVFLKLRIPAPSRGGMKQILEKWYPGNPDDIVNSLDPMVSKPLLDETRMERTELDALFEQFKCIAGHYYPDDPSGLGIAIDRDNFDAYFLSSKDDKPSPANLIYDRIFAFYDTNQDGLIDFSEYVLGLNRLQDKSRSARLRRIFDGYDLDGDGYVGRKDFLRMFRAYHALSKELSREMIATQADFGYTEEELQETIQASQPISAAFGGGNLFGHESRAGQDKQLQANGDLQLVNGSSGILQTDSDRRGDRARAIGNAVLGDGLRAHPYRAFRREAPEDEPVMSVPYGDYIGSSIGQDEMIEEELAGPDPPLQTYPWPPVLPPTTDDITNALGSQVALEDITDPVDRTRVLYAQTQRLDAAADQVDENRRQIVVNERWRRRDFYLDEEEGMTKPQGYTEPDSSDEEEESPDVKKHIRNGASPRRASMASRSSSKVRFDDSAIDTDYETRSNASTRSIPVNERWGGYELSQAEADIGKDILYQALQQGFNQLLDPLFKEKEDEFMASQETRHARQLDARERQKYTELFVISGNLVDPRQVAEIEALRKRSKKEEAWHVATGNTEHLQHRSAFLSGRNFPVPRDPADDPEWMNGDSSLPAIVAVDAPSSNAAEAEPYRDPTLPQFRPDESELSAPSTYVTEHQQEEAGPSTAPESQTQLSKDEDAPFTTVDGTNESRDNGDPAQSGPQAQFQQPPRLLSQLKDDLPAARNLYYLWQRHDLIDAEANRRGGGGKLSFSEFRRKMVPEDEIQAQAQAQGEGSRNKGKENEDPQTWESSADLGRLAFVGTWLEMASF